MAFPTIDREQSKKQLQLLGYKPGDNIFLRFFYPSDDPRKGSDAGRKLDKLVYPKAEKLQAEGRGCYFVVNGGGHSDDKVATGRAIFFEHDDRSKEQSANLWQKLNLPEPTFQVDTGGKSIHSYWVFDSPIPIEQWRSLQADLLEFADADRQLKNPSRVMRLAGAWHLSSKGQFQSFMSSCSEKKYSYQEMRSRIPQTVSADSQQNVDKQNGSTVRGVTTVNTVNTILENPPLTIFLTKDDRALIEGGAAQGSRNGAGAKLARNLLGTAERLQHLGIRFDGDPYLIFLDFCHKCQQSRDWNQREWDLIWKSAKADNPTSTLTDDALQTCYRAWQWRQNKKPVSSNGNGKNHFVNAGCQQSVDSQNTDRVSIRDTVNSVNTILGKGLSDWEEQAELDQLMSKTELSKDAYLRLIASAKTQLDEVLHQDKQHLNQLIDWSNSDLDFKKVLPETLAKDLLHDAAVLNIDPVAIWQYLLPATLSLIGKKIDLDIQSHRIPAIAWTGLIAESGTGKTRAEKLVLSPLKKWQGEERKRFEQDKERFEEELRSWSKAGGEDEKPEKPTPERKFLFEIGTIQAVMHRLSEQADNGSLWARDELAGLFKSLNQFSGGGESEALECLLKLWDGDPAQVDRMHQDASYFVGATRLSVAGGLQPLIFKKIFKDPDDPQGLQSRFLFALAKVQPAKRVKGFCHLSEKLPQLYKWLSDLPEINLKLNKEADQRFDSIYEQMGKEAEKQGLPAVRFWLRKLPGQTLRIAIALHFLECWLNPLKPAGEVQLETLERAVDIATYYSSTFKVIQENAADSGNVSSILLKIWDLALKSPDGILARDAYRSIRAISRRAKELGRSSSAYTVDLFHQLSEMGRGRLERDGRQIRFVSVDNRIFLGSVDSVDKPSNQDTASDVTVNKMLTVSVDKLNQWVENLETTILDYQDLAAKAEAGQIPAFDEQDVDYLVSEIAQARSAIDFQEWRLTALDQVQGEALWAAVCDRLKVVDPEVYQKWISVTQADSEFFCFKQKNSERLPGKESVNTSVDTVEKSQGLSFYEPGDVIIFDGQQYPVVKSDLSHVWIDGHPTHPRVAISEVRPASVEE